MRRDKKTSYRKDSAARRGSAARESKLDLVRSNKDNANRYQEKKVKKVRNQKKTKREARSFRLAPSSGLFKFFKYLSFTAGFAFSLVIISSCLISGYNLAITSDYFTLKLVGVKGAQKIKSEEIPGLLGLKQGSNVLALSVPAMQNALQANPWVNTSSVKRILPDQFEIQIEEKVPYYWIDDNGTLKYANEIGMIIALVTAGKFSSLPTLEVESGAEHLKYELPRLMADINKSELPWGSSNLVWVSLSAGREIGLGPDETLGIYIGLDEWKSNLRHTKMVVDDLLRRNDLKNAKEIRAYGGSVWVTTKNSQKRS